ncbi:MAG: hypothetical protein ACK58L_03240 [Planctomycetota bacterium]
MTSFLSPVSATLRGLLCILASIAVGSNCRADAVSVRELTVGIGGTGRVGNWVPVRITAEGLPGGSVVRLVITASDSRGDDCRNVAAESTADASGQVTLEGVFPPGRLDGSITVALTDDKQAPWWSSSLLINPVNQSAQANVNGSDADAELQSTLRLFRHQPLMTLTVGPMPGLSELIETYADEENNRDTLVNLVATSFASLPTMRRGYDAVDVIVLNSVYDLNAEQSAAIQEWVALGGHLIVSSGETLPALLSSAAGDWIRSLFGIQSELIRSQDLSSLQNYVIGANQLQTNRKDVSIVRVASKQSEAIVNSINGPLISRNTSGAGLVTFVSVDLNQDPLKSWLSLPLLYEMLIFGQQSSDAETRFRDRQMISNTGVSDLATQLSAVSDALPEDERWNSWHAMLAMIVFLAIVGPLDYLIAVRFLNRPRLTWLTFPAVVLSACGLTWWASDSGRRAETVRAVHLLDVGQSDSKQFARNRSWLSLSTRDSRFAAVGRETRNVWGDTEPVITDDCFTWYGRAEDVYGGLYRAGGAGLGRVTSQRIELNTALFESVPLLADGSYSFVAESVANAGKSPLFDSQLRIGAGGLLEGTFTHHLKSPIRNWIIAFGSRVYLPSPRAGDAAKELKPGEEWNRESEKVRISEIRDFLRGVRAVERGTTKKNSTDSNMMQVQTPYDSSSRDPQDILTMISLYEVAGGESYAKLANNAMRHDELSDSIPLTTAVLIGVFDEPLCDLTVDEQPVKATGSQTVVRFILPVTRTE